MHKTDTIEELHSNFQMLSYQNKVDFYHKHFGLIPFDFPTADLEVSWYTDEIKLTQLIQIFNEDSRSKNLFTKSLIDNKTEFVFDIRPRMLKQRMFLNNFILSKFLESSKNLSSDLTIEINNSENQFGLIVSKLEEITNRVEWIKYTIRNADTSLKTKFLKVLLNGYVSFKNGHEDMLKIRRKFAEIYFYVHGIRLAEAQNYLQKKYRDSNIKDETLLLNIQQKIVLLHELGIIEFLIKKFKKQRRAEYAIPLAQLILLMTSEKSINFDKTIKYLEALHNGTNSDLLTDKNVEIVRRELEKLDL
ncbi:MAG: hypothetical protein ABUT20_03180 [Bacteroidota bacterium]